MWSLKLQVSITVLKNTGNIIMFGCTIFIEFFGISTWNYRTSLAYIYMKLDPYLYKHMYETKFP